MLALSTVGMYHFAPQHPRSFRYVARARSERETSDNRDRTKSTSTRSISPSPIPSHSRRLDDELRYLLKCNRPATSKTPFPTHISQLLHIPSLSPIDPNSFSRKSKDGWRGKANES